jgi:hypothetical protein
VGVCIEDKRLILAPGYSGGVEVKKQLLELEGLLVEGSAARRALHDLKVIRRRKLQQQVDAEERKNRESETRDKARERERDRGKDSHKDLSGS